MREFVPGVVHSIAFSLDAQRLWCAHRDEIAVRAWPSLELLAIQPITSRHVVATVDGSFLAAVEGVVVEINEDGVVVRRVDVDGVVALGVDDHGAIVVVRFVSSGRYDVERHGHDGEVRLLYSTNKGPLLGRPWWLALLPTTKIIVMAIDDAAPVRIDVATGETHTTWDWLPQWADRPNAPLSGARRSWLSVDVAIDERCFVASDKGQGGTVVWLDSLGRIERYVALEPRRPLASDEGAVGRLPQKGPSRGAASAVHPHDNVVATIDISGRLHVNDASTGGLLDLIEGVFSGGYRWEGRARW